MTSTKQVIGLQFHSIISYVEGPGSASYATKTDIIISECVSECTENIIYAKTSW